jgi:hypothetical protein
MSSSRKVPAIFYRSASGSEPVREWLKALDKADRQTVGEDIAYVQYKWPIGKPRVDHLRGPNPADIELATKRLKEWINGQSK